jgi:hypothetical protein
MPPSRHWLTAQHAAAAMNTTSAEICRLLALGRLHGEKQKQPGRPGNGQWLIDPKSITSEKYRAATRAAGPPQRGRPPAKLRAAKKPRKKPTTKPPTRRKK